MSENVLNPSTGEVFRSTDPVILPQPYASPTDFAAQYPVPLDTTELITLCEEVTLLSAIPEQDYSLKQYTWREMTSLAFTSGTSYLAFADGECPEEYTHGGSNVTVTLKNIGAKKTLSFSDIKHSQAVAGANWHGINTLVAGAAAGEGLPGAMDVGTFQRQAVRNVKEKEARLAATLVLNGEDRLLVKGNASNNSLEFDGIENWETNMSCSFHSNDNSASGTFSATSFDRWLSEACANPTHLLGHPQIMQELMASYMQLGWQGSQVINVSDGNRMTPGFNFGSYVNTGIGRLQVVADTNFTKSAAGTSTLQGSIWAMRMTHNGEPLVYRLNQFPLSYQDLQPGCTAVSFQLWKKTVLVIKACCAHGRYITQITGRSASSCSSIV